MENAVQVAVLLATGGMAGAASFTHMHDWTMANSPAGTGDWFGWTNAIVADLIPMAAALEIRRRRRAGRPIGYPLVVLVAFVGLSLAAQVARATPSASGWLLACVPALGFLALTKLVLSRTPAGQTDATQFPQEESQAVDIAVDNSVELLSTPVAELEKSLAWPPAELPTQRPREASDTATAVANLVATYPDMSTAEMAERLQVSGRTVRRYLAELRTTTKTEVADASMAAA